MRCSDCWQYKTEECSINPNGVDLDSTKNSKCFVAIPLQLEYKILDEMVRLPDVFKQISKSHPSETEWEMYLHLYLSSVYPLPVTEVTVKVIKNYLRIKLQDNYTMFWLMARDKVGYVKDDIPKTHTKIPMFRGILRMKVNGVNIWWYLGWLAFLLALYLLYELVLRR